jgi:hypothetical protein
MFLLSDFEACECEASGVLVPGGGPDAGPGRDPVLHLGPFRGKRRRKWIPSKYGLHYRGFISLMFLSMTIYPRLTSRPTVWTLARL